MFKQVIITEIKIVIKIRTILTRFDLDNMNFFGILTKSNEHCIQIPTFKFRSTCPKRQCIFDSFVLLVLCGFQNMLGLIFENLSDYVTYLKIIQNIFMLVH